MMYICAHCGNIEKTADDVSRDPAVIDTGTTFTCMQCGKDTVVLLLKPEDYHRLQIIAPPPPTAVYFTRDGVHYDAPVM